MHRWIHALISVAATGLIAACGGGGGDGDTGQTDATLAQRLQASGTTDTMSGAVSTAGLTPMLSGEKRYTLLMPDDAAMAPYGDDLNELSKPENRASLQDYLKAHIVEGEVLEAGIAQAAAQDSTAADNRAQSLSVSRAGAPVTVRNLLGDELEVTSEGGVVKINGAVVTRADQRCRNGVIHFLGGPLFRPTVFGVVKALPQTSTLEAAVRAAGLTDALRARGSLTLFAPTNDAFTRLLSELNLTADQLLANKPLLTKVLTYHVLASRVLAADIVDGSTPATLQGQAIELDVARDVQGRKVISVVDARGRTSKVTFANLRAANGVVHLVDRVFLPSDKTIVDIAAANPQFSILVEAVTAAGLADTLSGTGPFSVFAPTNDAFVALLGELGLTKAALLADKALLTRVLTYHVLASRSLADSFTNGLARATVQGQPLRFARDAQGLALVDANGRQSRVTLANVQASNGVIHAIDKVVLPTSKNLVQVAQSLPQFSILVEAVVAAGLVDTLSGPGPFTVFAPTNDAFAALLTELNLTKAQLLANTALLGQVLTYHVVPAQVLSSQIPFGQPVTTVQGQTFAIGSNLKITDQRQRQAGVTATDVPASNGVVHVIDRVILPK